MRRLLKIPLPTFCFDLLFHVSDGMFLLGWTDAGLDAECQPKSQHANRSLFVAIYHDLSSAGHEADVEIDRFILCENGPLFFTKLALEPAGAIVILNFSSISNALQTCKWYLGNLLRSLKFDLGFKMQVPIAMPLQTSLEVPPGD